MGIKKYILKVLKKKGSPHALITDEDEFYTELFTKNKNWNKVGPNVDETLRWSAIKSLIEEHHYNSAKLQLTILDLGCGRGWLSNLLSSFGSVLGIEPVSQVVTYANSLFPQLDIQTGTAETLLQNGYENGFDLIVSSEVIEHIHDHQKSIFATNIYKLLKKDGTVILSTPRREALNEWRSYTDPAQPIEDWISENDLKMIFESVGFSVLNKLQLSKKPVESAPLIPVYQVWHFKKH